MKRLRDDHVGWKMWYGFGVDRGRCTGVEEVVWAGGKEVGADSTLSMS